jgi:ketosteroid isomerase-like protein
MRKLMALLLAANWLMAQAAGANFATATVEDEAAIRAIVKASSAGTSDVHIAADLDWENAFGIRYFELKKRDAFYKDVVAPLQKDAADTTLEVKIRFVEPNVAVADEYWHVAGQIDQATNKPGADRWGRTTYILKKQDGAWTEVLERVADLRLPYFKHYDAMPKAFPVPPETLVSYAGSYEAVRGRKLADVTVSGDHLQVTVRGRQRAAIPVSATEFLLFDPDDLAQYWKLDFAKESDGNLSAALSYATGEQIAKAMKAE